MSRRGPDPLTAALAACTVVLVFGVVTLGALVVSALPADPLAFLRPTDATAEATSDGSPAAPEPVAPAPPAPSADWEDYPGTAWDDSAPLLDAIPAEEQVALAEAFIAEVRTALTAEYGLEWEEVYSGSLYPLENGYGGDSLLASYSSAMSGGSVQLDDPGARAGIRDIVESLLPADTAGDYELSNDLYGSDPVGATAAFGAVDVDDQAVWRIRGYDALAPGLGFTVRIYDSSLPTDASFTGGAFFEDVGGPDGSLVVLIEAANYVLLPAANHDLFAERLAGYDESAKPEGEY